MSRHALSDFVSSVEDAGGVDESLKTRP